MKMMMIMVIILMFDDDNARVIRFSVAQKLSKRFLGGFEEQFHKLYMRAKLVKDIMIQKHCKFCEAKQVQVCSCFV